jgi:aspartokinase
VAARLFGALAGEQVNIQAIAQGSSEHNISVVISANQVGPAVRAVHLTFDLGGNGGEKVA